MDKDVTLLGNKEIAEKMARLFKEHVSKKEAIIKQVDELERIEKEYESLFVELNKRVKE